ncbi:hypothetical protein SAMN05878281_0073 [Salegentibacter salegens]|uniref:Uncharacterized protein n=1 Tax=Salegentibacter salegens TaxID=143223 RepID=A0A1M7HCB4_9FLAO|nr:hypothetical protein LY58_02320 [Salegentibacter salegens]SHM26058.1 hypothetical protein SAMN05878281_0073 [Salegentibacter salegens]
MILLNSVWKTFGLSISRMKKESRYCAYYDNLEKLYIEIILAFLSRNTILGKDLVKSNLDNMLFGNINRIKPVS